MYPVFDYCSGSRSGCRPSTDRAYHLSNPSRVRDRVRVRIRVSVRVRVRVRVSVRVRVRVRVRISHLSSHPKELHREMKPQHHRDFRNFRK